MDKAQLIAIYNQDQRIDVSYPDMRREVLPHVVRHSAAGGAGEGSISYSQLTAATADAVIREQIAYFSELGQDFEWKLYDYDQPDDLQARLTAHGFAVEEAEAIMVLPLDEAPSVLWQPVTHQIAHITEPDGLVDVLAIEQQVWDEDFSWVITYLGNALTTDPTQMSVYIAYVDRQPAGAAWTYFPKASQFASLWGGSTISQFRRQGLYTALLAVRVQEAKARGVHYLTVDASPMSRPILEKFGFVTIAYSSPCKWESTM